MKYAIIGAVLGVLASFGAWAIFTYVFVMPESTQAIWESAATFEYRVQYFQLGVVMLVFALTAWILGSSLDWFMPAKKR